MTPDEINALPDRLRRYIHWLETDCDPQGTIRENFRLREENAGLRAECERLANALRPFTFPAHPDSFRSDDGGCTEAIIPDEHVQEARRVLP